MAKPGDLSSSFAAQLAALSAQFAAQLGGSLDELSSKVRGQGPDAPRALLEDIHDRLHKLSGSGATFGFPELSKQARALEVTVKDWLEGGPAASPVQWQDWARGVMALRQSTVAPEAERDKLPIVQERKPKGEIAVVLVHAERAFSEEMCRGLGQFGYQVMPFADLDAADETLLARAPDILMLELTGDGERNRQLAQKLDRLFGRLGHRVTTIFLAPYADFTIQLAAARAGGDCCLALPVDTPTVAGRIEQLMRDRRQPPIRVLIMDDDEVLAEHYRLILSAAGMLAERVSHFDALMPALQKLHPDVLLMDLYMPEYSGAELARAIRYDDNWQGLPIVYMSSESNTQRQSKAMSSGADDFLVKPVADMQLLAVVRARARRGRKLAELMSQDSLTGLLKHANIKDRLQQELERARRQGKPVSVAMVDIDHFKRVNDSWGHPMGDQVIKTLGYLLRQRLRRQDSVGRYGGEEFMAILPECSALDAQRLLDDIRLRFAEIMFSCRGENFNVTFSAGIASSEQLMPEQDILATADKALYQAKDSGRNRVCMETPKATGS